MKLFFSILTTALIILPAISVADVGGGLGYQQGMFWGADLNRNERLDRDEAKAVYNLADPEIFSRYDKNGNGTINQTEFGEFIMQSPWDVKFVHPRDID